MTNMWKLPPRIKVYEALGAVADGRVKLAENSAKVLSSSGNKAYDVTFKPDTNELSVNDNGSYWQGYVGYPGLAFLMIKKLLPFDERLAEQLKGLAWKEINQRFKNDFAKTEAWIYETVSKQELETYAALVLETLAQLKLVKPLKRQRPPSGY